MHPYWMVPLLTPADAVKQADIKINCIEFMGTHTTIMLGVHHQQSVATTYEVRLPLITNHHTIRNGEALAMLQWQWPHDRKRSGRQGDTWKQATRKKQKSAAAKSGDSRSKLAATLDQSDVQDI